MNILNWLTGRFSVRREAMSHYKRGLASVAGRNTNGAMEAFTHAINLAEAPADVKAMALYNRALLFTGMGDGASAVADLNAVMVMDAELRGIKLAARRRLDRMQRQLEVAAAHHSDPRTT